MIDFSMLWDNIFPFVGKIFGLFSYLGTISVDEFQFILQNFWSSNILLTFTNVITGSFEVIQTTGFSNVILAPFILIAQGSIGLFKAILSLFNISSSNPLWFVMSSYLLVFTTIFGLIKGVISQFAYKA